MEVNLLPPSSMEIPMEVTILPETSVKVSMEVNLLPWNFLWKLVGTSMEVDRTEVGGPFWKEVLWEQLEVCDTRTMWK